MRLGPGMNDRSSHIDTEPTGILPGWLVALNESGGLVPSLDDGRVRPGDIRTLLGFEPEVSTCLVYVVDVGSSWLAEVVAVHDDPSMATHNDLIVYPENSRRKLNNVLRLPLRAMVAVNQLSPSAFDQLDETARSAIESFEFGNVPASTISVGTVTNGQNDPRWAFCDQTKNEFHGAVNASWRSFFRNVTDRRGLPEILHQFADSIDEPFTTEHLNSYVKHSAERDRGSVEPKIDDPPTHVEWFEEEFSSLVLIEEVLDEYAERIDSRKLDVSTVDSYLRQVDEKLKTAINIAEFQGIKKHFSVTSERAGLNREQVWIEVVNPQSPRIADDVRSLYQMVEARVHDQCASAENAARVSGESSWWQTRMYLGVTNAS